MSDKNTQTRSAYEPPKLVRIGSLEEVTQATTSGANFDGNFTVGQPIPPNIQMS